MDFILEHPIYVTIVSLLIYLIIKSIICALFPRLMCMDDSYYSSGSNSRGCDSVHDDG